MNRGEYKVAAASSYQRIFYLVGSTELWYKVRLRDCNKQMRGLVQSFSEQKDVKLRVKNFALNVNTKEFETNDMGFQWVS